MLHAEPPKEPEKAKNDEDEFEIIDNSTPESAQQGIQGTAESLTIEAERARALEEQKKTAANIPTYLEEQPPQTTKIEEVKEQAKTEEVQTTTENTDKTQKNKDLEITKLVPLVMKIEGFTVLKKTLFQRPKQKTKPETPTSFYLIFQDIQTAI